ncbi:MAG TPA: PIN domain-containing protein [Vicinamibacterales bacterium]|nr:PIN domain-containing protein [Vicinamibacterales bacterium]
MKLLVDTGALLALMLANDQHHEAAARFVRANPRTRFLLTNLILAEVVTRLRARAGAARAADAGRRLLDSTRYEVIFVDPALTTSALARLARLADKRLSLTDCVSFDVMDRFRLPAAFAFDHDFRDCGYRMVPE